MCEPAQSKIVKMHVSGNLQVKCCAPEPAPNADTHLARACAVEMHVNISREPLIRKFTRKMPAQNADTHFVRACAVEMHVSISQQPIYTEMFRKNADAQSEHPDQTPAFTPTVRTPQCEHTVWGTKRKPRLTLRNQETRKLRHPETRTSGNQETRKPNNQDMT